MDTVTFHSVWTVLMLLAFIGIVAWAWSSKRRGSFDTAAKLPLQDDEEVVRPEVARRPH